MSKGAVFICMGSKQFLGILGKKSTTKWLIHSAKPAKVSSRTKRDQVPFQVVTKEQKS